MERKEIKEFKEAKEEKRGPNWRVWKGWSREITSDGSICVVNCQVHLSVPVFSNATQAFEQVSVRARKGTGKAHRRRKVTSSGLSYSPPVGEVPADSLLKGTTEINIGVFTYYLLDMKLYQA